MGIMKYKNVRKKTIESEGVKSNWNILVYARCPAGEEWLRLRDTIWPAD